MPTEAAQPQRCAKAARVSLEKGSCSCESQNPGAAAGSPLAAHACSSSGFLHSLSPNLEQMSEATGKKNWGAGSHAGEHGYRASSALSVGAPPPQSSSAKTPVPTSPVSHGRARRCPRPPRGSRAGFAAPCPAWSYGRWHLLLHPRMWGLCIDFFSPPYLQIAVF